ncbi:hypothetical protein ZIOFF_064776 [Zingiber officinale]|uniref:K+ potassium transporter integral membrane domain-containing protein n=1 Tax=Zingiber officinale TaxID=94328 RepID=A0A8J5KCS8_ZINOF|nr:hypothetical protein ZIOFF_064776 [Zingiber officinale]
MMTSIASLIVLFSIQRFNTSKVGLAVGPALFIWFCSLAMIGIFNLWSEAMFADLCYFYVRSVQLTFVAIVLPCLLLGYLGQAAFLMENITETQQVFFSSIPRNDCTMFNGRDLTSFKNCPASMPGESKASELFNLFHFKFFD